MSAELVTRITQALGESKSVLVSHVQNLSGAEAARRIAAFRQKAQYLTKEAFAAKLDSYFVLGARETERRADRLIALAVQKGQRDGTIETAYDARLRAAAEVQHRLGRRRSQTPVAEEFTKVPVPTFLSKSDLSFYDENKVRMSIMDLAALDDLTFERLIGTARRSRRISKEAVLRSLREQTNVVTETLITAPVPKVSNRKVLTNAIEHLHSIEAFLAPITGLSADIDQVTAGELIEELRTPLATLNRIQKLLKNRATQ